MSASPLTLIRNGEIYAPEYLGRASLLLAGGSILHVGEIDRSDVNLPLSEVDATGCIVTPGFIDPHEHLIGAGGEEGFGSREPEVPIEEIMRAGITTVVGCLGTDTTSRTLTSLLAKVLQVEQAGITARMYTGGFPIPTPTITGSITDDLMVVDAVIGVGEIAISDYRSSQPSLHELARVVSQAVVGGLLSGKAGVAHFHVGTGRSRLSPLHDLLDRYEIPPHCVYPTHITRSNAHMDEAIALAKRGSFVDIDTVNDDFVPWLRYYLDHGGPASQLTVSSDAHTPGGVPHKVYNSFVSAARKSGLSLHAVLPFFTQNPASALQLKEKGHPRPGADADLAVFNARTLEIVHVFARGRQVLRHGVPFEWQEQVMSASDPAGSMGTPVGASIGGA